MRFLRTASTRRLLAVLAGLVAAIAATAAIAAAASGTGPVPRAQPLASAVHQGLTGPKVKGITADITFANRLIDSSALQGASGASDPILTGGTGRLWLSDHKLRLELQSNNGDVEVVVDHGRFFVSTPSSNTVYEGAVPTGLMGTGSKGDTGIPSIASIQKAITKLMGHVNLSGAVPGNVAGQPAYTVTVSPKHDAGLLGSAEVAWDAARGIPLRFAVYAKGNPTPVLELKATNISYGAVPASDFNVSPPAGAKIVKVATTQSSGGTDKSGKAAHHTPITGVRAVASKLAFPLVAKDSLVGLARQSVVLLDWGGSPAGLVTYGRGLGGIAVIERAAPKGAGTKGSGPASGSSNLSLPTVSINGATGSELDTALGTLVTFTRNGVSYTVIGSVPSAAADAAARGL